MAKKNQKARVTRFFQPSNPYDPIDSIFAEIGNRIVTLGIKKISKDVAQVLGLGGIPAEEQIRLNRSRSLLVKGEADLVRAEALSERQLKLLDLKIQQKTFEIEKAQKQLDNVMAREAENELPVRMEVVSGALEVTAEAEGIVGSPEQSEGYSSWLDSFQGGKVIVILGRRGSGKSALAGKLGEFVMAEYKMPTYWIGLPDQARGLVPNWIKLVSSPDQCPVNSFIICDEAGINYLSLLFNTSHNRFMRALLMICRQRHCSLVFAVQSSRDVDYSIVRQADSIIFKEPGLHQPDSERLDVRPRAKKAALAFKDMSKVERLEAAYVFDDDFEGIIKSTPPSFWSEDLSHVYAHLDLAAIEQHNTKKKELQTTFEEGNRLLEAASLEKEILELKRQGNGIEKIAKIIGCSTWRVRKCIEGMENDNTASQ